MTPPSLADLAEFGPVTADTRIVYTGGTFDIFHVGHVNLLAACHNIAGANGLVIVGLNTDDFIREYKGEHPVNNYAARMKVLLNSRCVNRVIPNTGGTDSKPAILRAFMATATYEHKRFSRFIVIGSDWASRDYYKQMGFTQLWLDNMNITLCYVPYTVGVSSSMLRRHIID